MTLLSRLQAATGPDREIDAEIGELVGAADHSGPAYHRPFKDWAKHYTASLDAALTLVPVGNWWEIGKTTDERSPMRHFGCSADGIFVAKTHASYGDGGFIGRHDAPAIALCIAALKARGIE